MNKSQIDTLRLVRKTLDMISVRGSDNLNMLLGSIQTMDKLIAEIESEDEKKEDE
jgi:hypothetical protein